MTGVLVGGAGGERLMLVQLGIGLAEARLVKGAACDDLGETKESSSSESLALLYT